MQAHQHIQEKKLYTVKNGGKVWLLNEITADKVKLAHTAFFGPHEDMEMEHKDLKQLKYWTKPVPALVWSPGGQPTSLHISLSGRRVGQSRSTMCTV